MTESMTDQTASTIIRSDTVSFCPRHNGLDCSDIQKYCAKRCPTQILSQKVSGMHFLLVAILSLGIVYAPSAICAADELSSTSTTDGFELLSQGDHLTNWKHGGNWKIESGVIARQGKGGSLVYIGKKMPDDFELQFEWKVGEGSNSGIYYRPTQYEYQILDNKGHPDGRNPRTSAASLYFCVQPSKDMTKPAGEWNTGRIVCKGTIIQHWLNGEKVIHLDYKKPKWSRNVDMLRQRGGNLDARNANLSLQDHGDPVWYRNIRLKELNEKDIIDMAEVTPAVIPAVALEAEKKKLAGIIKRREDLKQRQGRKKNK